MMLATIFISIWIWLYFNFINTSRRKQNGRHFGDDILNCISLNGIKKKNIASDKMVTHEVNKCNGDLKYNLTEEMVQSKIWLAPIIDM